MKQNTNVLRQANMISIHKPFSTETTCVFFRRVFPQKASVISHQRLLPPQRCHSRQTDSLTFPPYCTSKRAESLQDPSECVVLSLHHRNPHVCLILCDYTPLEDRDVFPFAYDLIYYPTIHSASRLGAATDMFSRLQRLEQNVLVSHVRLRSGRAVPPAVVLPNHQTVMCK